MMDVGELLLEQRERWARGERPSVETLVAGRHEISSEVLLDLVYGEMLLREDAGEVPRFEEYVGRFPALAEEIRLHFEVHETLRRERGGVVPEELPSIPGFELVGVLGRGGMGVVYEAIQTSLGRRVALKFLPREASDDEDSLRRFYTEARTASSLNHPNIAMIFDFGVHEGRPFIVMELVSGGTLHDTRREERSISDRVALVRQVAEALAAAHAAGVVHRDVKPANVMVRDDGWVKVLDFGLARLASKGGASMGSSGAGMIVGTPRYMSLEQVRGEPVGPASDVFSLGLVLYELVTGQHPFEAESVIATLAAVELRAVTPPRELVPAIDPALDALVMAMLDRRAEARPTMAEVARALASPSAATGAPVRRRGARLGVMIAAAIVGLASAAAVGLFVRSRTSAVSSAHAPASIVVLPFATVGDPSTAYFSAGVTEDITSMLARAPDIAVRSNSAALAYKDAPVDLQRVGRELDVGYVLEGSVRKDDRQVRITARLVDARTGTDVWAERLDRAGADPWALQDEIAGRIVSALTGEYGQLKRAQYRAAWGSDTTSLDEYDVYLRGHELYMRLTPDENDRAAEIWRTGLVKYPDSALLQAKLGFSHFMRPFLFLRDGADEDYRLASELVRRALAEAHLSPLENRLAHWLYAYVSCREGEWDRALREMDTTLALAPYDMFQLGDLSTIRILAGQEDEALAMLDRALAADPANRAFYQQLRGWALSLAGRYAESITALDEAIDLPVVPLLQAINHARLGHADEAKKLVEKAKSLHPEVTQTKWRAANFHRDPTIVERQLRDLAEAGLPP